MGLFSMSQYRRVFVPGGAYFFTVVAHERRPWFAEVRNIAALREAFIRVHRDQPFTIEAIVVLPDHLHCLWRLPEGDADFPGRWREIKKAASRAIAPVANARHEREVWQRRFWEHVIRDEADWRRHMDYIHYNPVKRGYAARPADWPWSTFLRAVARGWYEPGWGATEPAEIAGLEWE
jgi:putative transposase